MIEITITITIRCGSSPQGEGVSQMRTEDGKPVFAWTLYGRPPSRLRI